MSLKRRERYEAACRSYDETYRAEQAEKYLAALKRVPPRGRVLDAGCGTGLLAEYMRGLGYLDSVDLYVCLDYSSCMLSIASWRLGHVCPARCQLVEGNVEALPFPDSYFDVVYSFTVLDLVEDLDAAVSELTRVSRGPVVVSMMKKLPYKDRLLPRAQLLGVTSADVVLRIA